MHRLLIICAVLTCWLPAQAQQQTLLDGEVSHGGFGGLTFQASVIDGHPAYIQGVRGGWIINFQNEHSISLGLGSYDLENNIHISRVDPSRPSKLSLDYSTFELEYTYRTNRLLHFTAPFRIGGGDMHYQIENDGDADEPSTSFLVVEPGVTAELNIVSWFRVSAGVSYRWITGSDLPDLTDGDLNNLSGGLTLKFGGF